MSVMLLPAHARTSLRSTPGAHCTWIVFPLLYTCGAAPGCQGHRKRTPTVSAAQAPVARENDEQGGSALSAWLLKEQQRWRR